MQMVRTDNVSDGLHPSEVAVSIKDASGRIETIFMDRKQLVDGHYVPVGFPVGRDGSNVLVELPRETMRGSWRIWVPDSAITEGAEAA